MFAERLGKAEVPFTELPTMGGSRYMLAVYNGRFRGESAAVAALQYRYPILAYVDAAVFSSFGNAFDANLQDFAFETLFWNYGLSLASNLPGARLGVTIGFSSTRLDDPDFSAVERFRLVFGVDRGFM